MLIQFLLICVLLSIGFSFSFSSSTCFRKSLMSSSHLFLNLPIALLVFVSWTQIWTPLSSLFQSSFTRSSCNSQCHFSFHFLEDPFQVSNLCACHLVQCIYSASLYAIDPVFLFNRSWIHFLIWTVFKCHFPSHVILISDFVIGATHYGDVNFSILFFGFNILFLILFVLPFCLDNESQHLALCRLNHSFVFFVRCPCFRFVTDSRRNCDVEKS